VPAGVVDLGGFKSEMKAGDHRLSKPHEIALILRVLDSMVAGL
jgi:hypothetical protein